MRRKRGVILQVFLFTFLSLQSQEISKTWVPDLGNKKYKNPVIFADYSDPDVCRVGTDYYLTASSFNCIPGLPILYSKDLVNWKIINYAINKLNPESVFSIPQHGKGVWAPSIRFHKNKFYIYYGDPDYGIFMTQTTDPYDKWTEPILVKKGKGLIDPCPLWDDNGEVYLVHAFAGSRVGIKSLLAVSKLDSLGEKVISEDKIIYDGHEKDPTIEGPKFYKYGGNYYVFAPAGGVSTGWQVVLKSKNIYGPYERKVVMAQGKTNINGPHQGAWINTVNGENWFIHFQDRDAFGRVVLLEPMIWNKDGFPTIGINPDKNGCGEPVLEYLKPNVGKNYPILTPAESDEFNANLLGLQWQWEGNPQSWWLFSNIANGTLDLYSVPNPDNYKNLWDIPNLLLQKFPADNFGATVKLKFIPSDKIYGEKVGLVIMGLDYASLVLENTISGYILSQVECFNAEKGGQEAINESIDINRNDLYLRVRVTPNAKCIFSYSLDGKNYKNMGKTFTIKQGKWIGAKMGMFCLRPTKNNDGGKVMLDWFHVEK